MRKPFTPLCLVLPAGIWALSMADAAATATGPAATTRGSATRPAMMKPISAAEEATYSAALATRAQAVLDDLKLKDEMKAGHVREAVIAQYRALRAWHDTYDEDLKSLSKDAAANASPLAEINATLTSLHKAFLAKLGEDLTPEQVEVVKDRMTYGTVKVTYDEYLKENPALTEPQKAWILQMLKEARELAMDDGSQPEKAATFKKYKGRINNMLATWKKEATTAPASATSPKK